MARKNESLNICAVLIIKMPLKYILSANLFLDYTGIEKKCGSLKIRCHGL
jgi:hypothetical protein